MNIAGVIKDWMLIFFSYYVFQAPITNINLLGYVFCCSGVRSNPPGGLRAPELLLVRIHLHDCTKGQGEERGVPESRSGAFACNRSGCTSTGSCGRCGQERP